MMEGTIRMEPRWLRGVCYVLHICVSIVETSESQTQFQVMDGDDQPELRTRSKAMDRNAGCFCSWN